MRTSSRLGVFGLGVAAVFSLAAAVGAGLDPIDVGAPPNHSDMPSDAGMSSDTDNIAEVVELSGLTVTADGYRFVADITTVPANTPSRFAFRIVDSDDSALTEFDTLHERQLHLIVLSRNMVDYLHLHPLMDADGTWRVDLPALSPGSYRVYADFKPNGSDRITLATDLSVPGLVEPFDVPKASPRADIDGFTVSLSGDQRVGESTLTFNVTLNATAVVTEPYLGAAGHLVVIRQGDLGYLHVHPLDSGSGPVRFAAEFPTLGTYRLFFEFSYDGIVRTASFTVEVAASNSTTNDSSMSGMSENHESDSA